MIAMIASIFFLIILTIKLNFTIKTFYEDLIIKLKFNKILHIYYYAVAKLLKLVL